MAKIGGHAVVLGASMSGLLATRVLAEFYRTVTVIERDVLPKLEEAILWIRRDAATCKDSAAARVAAYVRATPFNSGALDAWIDYLQPIAASLRLIDFRYCGALSGSFGWSRR